MRNIFSDPTATAAIARVDRERREAARRDKRDLDRAYAAYLRQLAKEAREAREADAGENKPRRPGKGIPPRAAGRAGSASSHQKGFSPRSVARLQPRSAEARQPDRLLNASPAKEPLPSLRAAPRCSRAASRPARRLSGDTADRAPVQPPPDPLI